MKMLRVVAIKQAAGPEGDASGAEKKKKDLTGSSANNCGERGSSSPPTSSLSRSLAASALQTGVCNEGFPAFRRLRHPRRAACERRRN